MIQMYTMSLGDPQSVKQGSPPPAKFNFYAEISLSKLISAGFI